MSHAGGKPRQRRPVEGKELTEGSCSFSVASQKMNWLQSSLSKIKQALFKTSLLLKQDIEENKFFEINDEFYEDLFDKFIKADIGVDLSEEIISSLKKQIHNQQISKECFQTSTKEDIKKIVGVNLPSLCLQFDKNKLNIFLIVGVNGSGKTTSIGKLAKRFKTQGAEVLIVAGDTFRAAASDQLSMWADRAGVEIFSPIDVKKPDAVVFSSIEKARKENYNLLLIDTAGRLHSQANLMNELKKVSNVIEKNASDSVRENLIILDATIGQNAITQAELFSKAIGLTGIILAKLDSSAKGGVVLNIMNKLSLPVKLIGIGESIDDLVDFKFDEYLEGLLTF